MMLDDIIKERIKKIHQLKKLGIDPYPEKTKRQFTIAEVLNNFASWSKNKKKIIIAGRIWSLRGHGGVMFCDIKDETNKLQLVLKSDILGTEKVKHFEKYFDLGDFVEAQGTLFITKRGEKSLLINDFHLLSKSLRPLPKAWFGLEDAEERFRRRYLDLLENEEVKKRFIWRSQIITNIRNFLNKQGYLEVETPILQTVYGGANANPFLTKLDALKIKLYLRIAPELYLKRLLIGGFEKIYEIGKNFRNEGMDREHNPEFTMIELYSAYQTREDLMKLSEKLIKNLVRSLNKEIDNSYILQKLWPRIDFEEFLTKQIGLTFKDQKNSWLKKAQELGVENINPKDSVEKIADLIFKKLRTTIKNPTFIINQPLTISPLAKQNPQNPQKTLRFLLVINGWEIANGFSELNDPLDQKERFLMQAKLKKEGDKEAHPQDQDFIEALEYGMPPAAGLGIGIDRLVAVLTHAPSLKEIIFFPFMKPK
ncbi:MAG: lysine--tRNA ligase [Parcubacteria group bacterium]|nr:lysine--tRNA ligase [Parcubacteria group bacterium]